MIGLLLAEVPRPGDEALALMRRRSTGMTYEM